MRILSIKLKNINSLRGEWDIDFTRTPLKDAGLFAMIGATGSGKSTILDCITLALYNQVPRLQNISKDSIEKGGMILTKNEKDCYAEVRYACQKGVFTSRWSISKTRNNTLRDYEMQVFDEQGIPLTDKKSKVATLNAENIGLDYEQFIKSILLSQGDFARFLKSNKNDRAQLLEEITGTREFRKYGRKAYFVYKRKLREIENQLGVMKSYESKLVSDEEEEALKQELDEMGKDVTRLQIRNTELQTQISLRKRLLLLEEEIVKKKEILSAATIDADQFERQYAAILSDYTELLPYKLTLQEYIRQRESLLHFEAETGKNEGLAVQLSSKISGIIAQASRWTREDLSESDISEKLEAFRSRVEGMLRQLEQWRKDSIETAQRIITGLRHPALADAKFSFRETGENTDLLHSLRRQLEDSSFLYRNHMEGQGWTEAQLPALKSGLQQNLEELVRLQSEVLAFMQLKGRLAILTSQKESLQATLQQSAQSVTRLEQELSEEETRFAAAEKAYGEMFSAKKLEEHRARLVEGEPCPVCGSTVHPYVHAYAHALSDADDEFQKARLALQSRQQTLQDARIRTASAEKEWEGVGARLAEDEKSNAAHLVAINTAKQRLSIDKIGSGDTVEGYIVDTREKLAAAEYCEKQLIARPLLVSLRGDVENYDTMKTAMATMATDIHRIYPGNDIQGEYKKYRDGLQSAMAERTMVLGTLQSVKQQAGSLRAALLETEQVLIPHLQALGYASIAEALGKLIPETEFHTLRDTRNKLKTECGTAAEMLRQDQQRLQDESANADMSIPLEALVQQQASIQAKLKLQLQVQDDKKLVYHTQLQTREEIKILKKEIKAREDANRPWDMLNRLIGDATGTKFNTYAQELTLKQLLGFANRRLQKLHSRYSLAMPEKGEEDDLVVVDTHMGHERRSVKTLSGGETFIVSLALALGLSDLAARDIRIESLFIDEGFGTLDPETLEEAIDTLEQLQAEAGKTVGIISHVDSLKERIYTQIQLEKQSNGFSTVRIQPSNNQQPTTNNQQPI